MSTSKYAVAWAAAKMLQVLEHVWEGMAMIGGGRVCGFLIRDVVWRSIGEQWCVSKNCDKLG